MIAGRLEKAKIEFREIPTYDYLVINDKVSNAVEEIEAILVANECRVDNRRNIFERGIFVMMLYPAMRDLLAKGAQPLSAGQCGGLPRPADCQRGGDRRRPSGRQTGEHCHPRSSGGSAGRLNRKQAARSKRRRGFPRLLCLVRKRRDRYRESGGQGGGIQSDLRHRQAL